MSFFVLTLALLLSANDEPEPVAMVLSVQGDVKLRRMDLLRAGDVVRVPAAGSVRLVFIADGHREILGTAGTVKVTESGGTPAAAVEREKASVPRSQLNGLRELATSARAGVSRVRDVLAPPLPLSPINSAVVHTDRPSFEWTPVRNVTVYDVLVFRGETDRKENLLWSIHSASEHLEFPKGRKGLVGGETYTWKALVGQKEVAAQGTFTVATTDEVNGYEPIRKLADSTDKSDRLLAAMLYEAGRVYENSYRLFDSLAKESPSEPWVILASARHLARLGRIDEATRREKEALALLAKP